MKVNKLYIILGAVALLLLIGVGSCISTRNSIVTADQATKKEWGNVESQYQRRLDLIPNLVNTVKGYVAHEANTLQAVTDARVGLKQAYDEAKAQTGDGDMTQTTPTPDDLARYQQAQSNLNRQLGVYINAVHEAYPDLKANQNFLDLQAQLEGTENRIATARQRYNEAVETYNNKILRFPGSLFAWGYMEKPMFKADTAASHAPSVDFGTGSPSVDF